MVIKQNPALGSPSELPRVAMLQPADAGNRLDDIRTWWKWSCVTWCLLFSYFGCRSDLAVPNCPDLLLADHLLQRIAASLVTWAWITDYLPANVVPVATVFRIRKKANDGVLTHSLKGQRNNGATKASGTA